MSDGGRYDVLLDVGGRLLRVQCKWASCYGDVLIVRCYSTRRTLNGMLVRRYSSDEIDAIAAYSAELERCFFLPITRFAGRRQVQLRLSPARSNQRLGVNWADDYDFERLDWSALTGP